MGYIDVDQTTTLKEWCDKPEHNCCQGEDTCIDWSSVATYEVCKDSCNNEDACKGVAKNAQSGATIKFDVGSCNGEGSCLVMGPNLQTLIVKRNGCNGEGSCNVMAFEATNLQTLVVGENSCTESYSCNSAAYDAKSLKQLFIDDEQCKSGSSCKDCGRDSTFDDTLQVTETCCEAVFDEDYFGNFDEACNYSTTPPEEPNPCKNVHCSYRGKCQVLSLTEAECKCENTFIPSENKLDCICPSNHEFNADVNRCFPITEAPSKSPTISPTKTSSTSPSHIATIQEDVCEDDETATFQLIKIDKDVPCAWITKNWKKRAIREEKYCGLDEVKAICPATCGLCS